MRWDERQAKVKELSYQSIDELSDEFNLDLPFYPEVYWIGRSLDFDYLGLPSKLRDEFDDRFSLRLSSYFRDQSVILINKYGRHDIFEESTHFLHLINSGIEMDDSLRNGLWKNVFIEMLGFFGARFLGSSAINGYGTSDLMKYYSPESDSFDFSSDNIYGDDFNYESFFSDFIYQQGYHLGEVLFFKFINGKISRREISNMFGDNLRGSSNAREKVLELRSKFWPVKKQF